MRITVITIFPEFFDSFRTTSIIKRAIEGHRVDFETVDFRSFTLDKHRHVDDTPYGGGQGMVLSCQPIIDALRSVRDERSHVVMMTPQGATFSQKKAARLATYEHLILLCGHYEGFDERIRAYVDEEISMGDFVLTGGEIPAMAVADAVCRMVPGVLPDAECFEEESHWNGLLEYPQYSRPAEWHGRAVPEILLSGDHGKVAAWRKKQSYKRSMERRPDLFAKFDKSQLTTKADKKILAEAEAEFVAEHPDCAAERAES